MKKNSRSRSLIDVIDEEIESHKSQLHTFIETQRGLAGDFMAYLKNEISRRDRELSQLKEETETLTRKKLPADERAGTALHDSCEVSLLLAEQSSEITSLREELLRRIDQLLAIGHAVAGGLAQNQDTVGETRYTHVELRKVLEELRAQAEEFRHREGKLALRSKEKERALHEKDLQLADSWNRIQAMRLINRVKRLFFLDRLFYRR